MNMKFCQVQLLSWGLVVRGKIFTLISRQLTSNVTFYDDVICATIIARIPTLCKDESRMVMLWSCVTANYKLRHRKTSLTTSTLDISTWNFNQVQLTPMTIAGLNFMFILCRATEFWRPQPPIPFWCRNPAFSTLCWIRPDWRLNSQDLGGSESD